MDHANWPRIDERLLQVRNERDTQRAKALPYVELFGESGVRLSRRRRSWPVYLSDEWRWLCVVCLYFVGLVVLIIVCPLLHLEQTVTQVLIPIGIPAWRGIYLLGRCFSAPQYILHEDRRTIYFHGSCFISGLVTSAAMLAVFIRCVVALPGPSGTSYFIAWFASVMLMVICAHGDTHHRRRFALRCNVKVMPFIRVLRAVLFMDKRAQLWHFLFRCEELEGPLDLRAISWLQTFLPFLQDAVGESGSAELQQEAVVHAYTLGGLASIGMEEVFQAAVTHQNQELPHVQAIGYHLAVQQVQLDKAEAISLKALHLWQERRKAGGECWPEGEVFFLEKLAANYQATGWAEKVGAELTSSLRDLNAPDLAAFSGNSLRCRVFTLLTDYFARRLDYPQAFDVLRKATLEALEGRASQLYRICVMKYGDLLIQEAQGLQGAERTDRLMAANRFLNKVASIENQGRAEHEGETQDMVSINLQGTSRARLAHSLLLLATTPYMIQMALEELQSAQSLWETQPATPETLTISKMIAIVFLLKNDHPKAASVLQKALPKRTRLVNAVLASSPGKRQLEAVQSMNEVLHLFVWVLIRWRAVGEGPRFQEALESLLHALIMSKGQIFDAEATADKRLPDEPRYRELKRLQDELHKARHRLADAALSRQVMDDSLAGLEKQVQEVERQAAEERRRQGLTSKADLLDPDHLHLVDKLPAGAAVVEYVRVRLPDALWQFTDGPEPFEVNEPREFYAAFLLACKRGPSGPQLVYEMVNLPIAKEFAASEIEKQLKSYLGNLPTQFAKVKRVVLQGHTLRQFLLDPVLEQCKAVMSPTSLQHLYVAPDGLLSRLPFVALPAQDGPDGLGAGRHILDDDSFTISSLVSARDLLLQPEGAQRERRPPLVLAAPAFDKKTEPPESDQGAADSVPDGRGAYTGLFEELEFSKSEGEEVSKVLGGALVTGAAATAEVFLQCNAPRVLHVATHGFALVGTDCDSSSVRDFKRLEGLEGTEIPLLRCGLAFAGAKLWQEEPEKFQKRTGIVTAMEMLNMNLQGTELAVLSACCTGLGEVWHGQGSLGVGRALQLVGAESTMVSLWKVPDQSTSKLMPHFYRKLAEVDGSVKLEDPFQRARALRDAQRAIKNEAKWSLPGFWAAFVLYGRAGLLSDFHPEPQQLRDAGSDLAQENILM